MTRLTNGKTRDEQGRFVKGNPGGPGNPFAAQVNRLRSALLNAVSEADIVEVITTLVAKAKQGDVAAIKVLFDRLLGKPFELDKEAPSGPVEIVVRYENDDAKQYGKDQLLSELLGETQ